jgi:hypothetical protein
MVSYESVSCRGLLCDSPAAAAVDGAVVAVVAAACDTDVLVAVGADDDEDDAGVDASCVVASSSEVPWAATASSCARPFPQIDLMVVNAVVDGVLVHHNQRMVVDPWW